MKKKKSVRRSEEERGNLMRVVLNALTDSDVSQAKLCKDTSFAKSTISSWKSGKVTPYERTMVDFFKKIKLMLENDTGANLQVMESIKEKRRESAIVEIILSNLPTWGKATDFFQYYLKNYENILWTNELLLLLEDNTYKEYIEKILFEKLQVKKNWYKFFSVENWPLDNEYGELPVLENGCFLLLHFLDENSAYSYKVLIGIYDTCQEEDARLMLDSIMHSEDRSAAEIKMMVVFAVNAVSEEEQVNHSYARQNMYVERLELQKTRNEQYSSMFIYKDDIDKEQLVTINRLCDLVCERLERYFEAIYKNILFGQPDKSPKETRRLDKGFLWEARYANRHEANFECERIKELMGLKMSGNTQEKMAVALGFESFPVVIMLKRYFQRIVLLDNSSGVVEAYRKQYRDDNSVEVYIFSSGIGNFVTNIRGLYKKADLVVAGVGYAGFFKNQSLYYQYMNTWLKEDGIAYLSYYNGEFPYSYITQATLEENMDFLPMAQGKIAKVNISPDEKYYIYCELATVETLKIRAGRYFNLVQMYSYPLASLTFGPGKRFIQNILKELDKEYARKGILSVPRSFSNSKGCFLDVACRKRTGNKVISAEPKGKEIMTGYAVSSVGNFEELQKEGLKKNKENFVKLLILESQEDRTCYAVLLPFNKPIPETTENEVVLFNKKLRFLTIAELNGLGFETGSVMPFFNCLDETIQWKKLCDKSLLESKNTAFFAASGSCDKVLVMNKRQLMHNIKQCGYDCEQYIGGDA